MKTKRVALLGLCIALSMILSFVESRIPPLVAVPGVKIGLPNLVLVFMLYRFGWKQTAVVSLLRVLLSSILFGSVLSLLYSLVGASLSLLGMALLKRTNLFSCVAVSVVGGVLHNVGQIVVACAVMETPQIAYYLPVLLISGTLAGIVIGVVSAIISKRLEKFKF